MDMANQSAKRGPVPLLLVLLLLGVFCRLSSQEQLLLRFTTLQKASDQTTSYISSVPVGGSTARDFSLSTSSDDVSVTGCASNTTNTTTSFSLVKKPSSLASESTVIIKNVRATCGSQNVLGLGGGNLSFPFQVTKAAKLPHIFWYCLGTKSEAGEINFGRKGPYTVYYNTDVLNATSLPMRYIPLSYDSSFFRQYVLSLNRVAIGTKSVTVDSIILIGNTIRYTSLPEPAYQLVRDQFISEAASKKLKKDSSTFGELDLCYKMTLEQRATFSTVKLIFNGVEWPVAPDNYLAVKSKGVVCFGFINASHLPRGISVIGTLQQENNFVEYDVVGKKLGVSGSLAANLGLRCSSTHGTEPILFTQEEEHSCFPTFTSLLCRFS